MAISDALQLSSTFKDHGLPSELEAKAEKHHENNMKSQCITDGLKVPR
jgi:hypothetical protein